MEKSFLTDNTIIYYFYIINLQRVNGADYDDIVFAEDPFISESYRDRIIVDE